MTVSELYVTATTVSTIIPFRKAVGGTERRVRRRLSSPFLAEKSVTDSIAITYDLASGAGNYGLICFTRIKDMAWV